MPRLPAPLRDLADRASAYTATIPVPVMAALWMVGSGVFFTGLAGTIRHLGQEMHPFEVAFFRNLFGLVFMLPWLRSEEHTSELQSLMRISYAVFCLKKKN